MVLGKDFKDDVGKGNRGDKEALGMVVRRGTQKGR